jgi:hypothetical protein
MARRRVLITGAAGYVAGRMLPALQERYECVLSDVRETTREGDRLDGVHLADLSERGFEQHRKLFRGIEAVIHCGYVQPKSGSAGGTPETYYAERRNVDMAFHVYQLSLEEGVGRVVMASSNHAADWYEGLIHAKQKDFVDPWERAISDNYYGWAKEAYEHLGFVFASGRLGRKLEVVQLRIGAPREIQAAKFQGDAVWYHRDLGAYLSARDQIQLFVRSIEAAPIEDRHGIPFQIFYGISDNTRKFWSIANAREVIGYAPEDDSEVSFAEEIRMHLVSLGTPIPPTDFNPGPGTA